MQARERTDARERIARRRVLQQMQPVDQERLLLGVDERTREAVEVARRRCERSERRDQVVRKRAEDPRPDRRGQEHVPVTDAACEHQRGNERDRHDVRERLIDARDDVRPDVLAEQPVQQRRRRVPEEHVFLEVVQRVVVVAAEDHPALQVAIEEIDEVVREQSADRERESIGRPAPAQRRDHLADGDAPTTRPDHGVDQAQNHEPEQRQTQPGPEHRAARVSDRHTHLDGTSDHDRAEQRDGHPQGDHPPICAPPFGGWCVGLGRFGEESGGLNDAVPHHDCACFVELWLFHRWVRGHTAISRSAAAWARRSSSHRRVAGRW